MRVLIGVFSLLLAGCVASDANEPAANPHKRVAPNSLVLPPGVTLNEHGVPVISLASVTTRPITEADLEPYPRDWIEATRAGLPSARGWVWVEGTLRSSRDNQPIGGARVWAESLDGAAPVYPSMHYHRGTLTDALVHPANPVGETTTAADGTFKMRMEVTGTGWSSLKSLLYHEHPGMDATQEEFRAVFVMRADVSGAVVREKIVNVALNTSADAELLADTPPWVTGRVVTEGAAPLVGATVYVEQEPGFRYTTRTDAAGRYRFPAQPVSGDARVTAVHNHGMSRIQVAGNAEATAEQAPDIVLRFGPRDAAVVQGRLQSPDPSGEPAMSRIMLIQTVKPDKSGNCFAASSRVLSDGRFRIVGPYSGRYRLGGIFPGGAMITEEVELTPGKVAELGTISIPPPAQVMVRVVDCGGRPVSGASVSTQRQSLDPSDAARFLNSRSHDASFYNSLGTTDAHAAIFDMSPRMQSVYFTATHPDYLRAFAERTPGHADPVTIQLSRGASINATLTRSSAPVSGQWLELEPLEVTGTPEGILPEDQARRMNCGWLQGETDASGAFSFIRLPPGRYQLSIHRRETRFVVRGFLSASISTTIERTLEVTGEENIRLALQLPDEVSPVVIVRIEGVPHAGARAWLEPLDGDVGQVMTSSYDPDRDRAWPATEQHGRLALPDMPAGTYRLVVQSQIDGNPVKHTQQVSLRPDSREFTVNLPRSGD